MAKTSMNIRMDSDIKQQAQQIFSTLGMDLTTAVNIFLRQTIRYQGLPFDVSLNTPNSVTLSALAEGDLLLSDKKAMRFSCVDDLFTELDS